jgi:hypothetical protein
MEGIASIDLFVVPTIAFQQLQSGRAADITGTTEFDPDRYKRAEQLILRDAASTRAG